jgi:cytochrome c oxidase subunit IV
MDDHLPEATPESVDHAHTEHIVPRRTFYAVFAVLILLTVLTTGVAFVDLGPFNTVAALTIAVLKMLLVALFFMHVKYSGLLTKVVVGGGLFWLLILIGLTMQDYLTRGWLPYPGK